MKNTALTILLMFVVTLLLVEVFAIVITPIKNGLSESITDMYLSGGVYDEAAIRRYSSLYGFLASIIVWIPIPIILYVDFLIWKRHKSLKGKEVAEK